MNIKAVYYAHNPVWFLLVLLSLSISSVSFAATPDASKVKTGSYCPATDIKLIVAEELSASLDLAMRSRAAALDNDRMTAISEMSSLGTTLNLAASRGGGGRTGELIAAITHSRPDVDYAQMLEWMPLLRQSLKTLPQDASEQAALKMIDQAEAIMSGNKDGNPLKTLKQASQLLSCEGLSIPIQQARQAQLALLKQLDSKSSIKNSDYDTLLGSLRNALTYTLAQQG